MKMCLSLNMLGIPQVILGILLDMVFPHFLITTQVLRLKWSSITSNTILTFIPLLLVSLVPDLSYALSLVPSFLQHGQSFVPMSVVSLVFPSVLLDTLDQAD